MDADIQALEIKDSEKIGMQIQRNDKIYQDIIEKRKKELLERERKLRDLEIKIAEMQLKKKQLEDEIQLKRMELEGAENNRNEI